MQLVDYKDYHSSDKILDSYFLVFMAAYSWRRWRGLEKNIAQGLFGWRMIGFVAFQMTGTRWLLLIFPNLFMWWWVFVAGRDHYKPNWEITNKRAMVVLAIVLIPNMLSEITLHFFEFSPIGAISDFFGDIF